MNDAGEALVTWSQWDEVSESFDVFERRFDSDGKAMGSERRVNSTTPGDQGLPSVSADGSGEFVIAWQSYLQDGSSEGVFGQRIAPSGVRIGGEFEQSVRPFLGLGQGLEQRPEIRDASARHGACAVHIHGLVVSDA